MITELLFNALKVLLLSIFGLLPTLPSIPLPIGMVSWFANIAGASAYFLPVADFLVMFGIWLAFVNFELTWKIIQRVWDALPFT